MCSISPTPASLLLGAYPPTRRTQPSAVREPEVGEHDVLEGARPCRAGVEPVFGQQQSAMVKWLKKFPAASLFH
jgi:hypothetical protein